MVDSVACLPSVHGMCYPVSAWLIQLRAYPVSAWLIQLRAYPVSAWLIQLRAYSASAWSVQLRAYPVSAWLIQLRAYSASAWSVQLRAYAMPSVLVPPVILTDLVARCRLLAAHGPRSCLSVRTQPPTATGAPSQASAIQCHRCHTRYVGLWRRI